ncbi:MAG: restriction endonuclease subunit S [Candidatus Dadabacteria bacterium]|nr:restriction endonuclease subunit S [Candidatus Dadabacteria bacterium]MYA48933.1 restriction endonuclease subunit S [Candidatus Dadabacteria bacterium]MYK22218.1 restriction endonuclease subunit S [Candidatus Poribacteria bacterium]
MASEWRDMTLGDVMTLQRGFDLPKTKRKPGNYPVIASTGPVGTHEEAMVTGPGVVIGRSGSLGGGQFIKHDFWPLNTTLWVKDFKGNEPRFCYFLLKSLDLTQFNAGSGVPTLNRNHIHLLPVAIPSPSQQRAIVHILGTLDDKIELNNQMNSTLKAITQALFRSWFVNFDPIRAKIEGRWRPGESLPSLPANLWDLFPDNLVDSELGKIPDGWKPTLLGKELAELVSGSRPKGGAVKSGIPSIGAENVIGLGHYDFSKEKYIPIEFFEKLKTKGANLRHGDVLLYKDGAKIGRKTYFDQGFPHSQCAVNEHVFILRMEKPELQRYLFFWLDQPWITQEIISLNSNSAQPGINQVGVRSIPFLLPNLDLVSEFDKKIVQLIHRLFTNCLESRQLATMRDTLLPRLVSGELSVNSSRI